jgi:hypothetical protein
MAIIKILFHRALVDAQEYGSNDEFMVSRVFFSIEDTRGQHNDLYVDVKQTVGSDFESAPLEIGIPKVYDKAINYERFRNAIESYYRKLIGSQGRAIHVQGKGKVRLFNTTLILPLTISIESDPDSGGW